jgi:hypothetical protein
MRQLAHDDPKTLPASGDQIRRVEMTAKRSRNGGGGNGRAAVVNGTASRIVAESTNEIVDAGGLSVDTFCDFADGLSIQAVVLQQSGAEIAFCGISS